MHEVQGHLSIVDAGTVHPELESIRAGDDLRRQHRRFAENDYAALAEFHGDALRASGG